MVFGFEPATEAAGESPTKKKKKKKNLENLQPRTYAILRGPGNVSQTRKASFGSFGCGAPQHGAYRYCSGTGANCPCSDPQHGDPASSHGRG